MRFGLTADQYQFIHETAVIPLRRNGNEVYCFGSRARGDHRPFSDLDLMVEGKAEARSLVAKINEALSNSNFPFKVDLVLLEEFAASYVDSYKKDRTVWPA